MADTHYDKAIATMREWVEEAKHRGEQEAGAAALATADRAAKPSVRTVYLQFAPDGTPVFFVNAESGKGRQLAENPRVGLCWFSSSLHRQLVLEGQALPLETADADELWRQRHRDSALMAWVSHQEQAEGDTRRLQRDLRQARQAFDFQAVPRPESWVGYRVDPERIEFWNLNWRHARARHLYRKEPDGSWSYHAQEP